MVTEADMLRRRIAELEAENGQLKARNTTLESENLELQKSYDLYSQIIEHMPAGFVLYEPIYDDNGDPVDLRYLQTNALNEQMLGRNREAFLGKRYYEASPEGDISWLRIVSEATAKGESARFEYFSKVHQRRFDVIGYGPQEGHCAILFIDIEDRKQAEAALRESEKRLQTVVDNMPMMMIAADTNRQITLWNRECERVTGYSAEEMMGRGDFMELLYPDEAYRAALMAEAQERSGEYRGWEMELTDKDGRQKIIAWSNVSKQHPVKGWERWTLGVEVTPRVQAEQEIRRLNAELERRVEERTGEIEQINHILQDQIIESIQSQELVQQYADEITDLYNNAPCGYHSVDENGTIIRINNTELTWLGYTREEIVGKKRIADLMTPESREVLKDTFDLFKAQGWLTDVEMTLIRKDGSMMPVLINSTAMRDENGNFLSSRTTMFDMTERKKADALLQTFANELADLYNNAPCGYHSLDENGMFIRMNDTELKMLGYTREEVIGKMGLIDLIPPEDLDQFRKGFAELKATHVVRDVEGVFLLKDGTRLPILLNSTAAYDANGQFTHTRSTVFDMTERKKADALLQKYAAEFEELYNTAPFGYHTVDARGIFSRINDTELKWLGYTREELVGKVNMYDLLTPESVAIAQQHTPQFRERGWVENLELTVVCKNGRKIPMLFSGQAIVGAKGHMESIRVTLVDITERKKTDALLQETSDELADLYDNAPCGYYSLDANGVFVRINETQLKMLGYSREEVVGRMKIYDLYAPDRLPAAVERFEILRTTGSVRDIETVVQCKDGSSLPVLINSSVVYDENGEFVRTRSTMFDMSELRKAQDIIMELNQHLEERALMLESANKELESFSYSVSHDLRAPLRAIDGFSRVVIESYGDALPEQGQHYLRRVRENAGRMGQLIDDLLDFSRMSRRAINKTPISPQQIAAQVVTEIREQQPNMTAEVIIDDLPKCEADGTLVKQVYANLIGNAVKFTRKQDKPLIHVGYQQSNGELIYYVKDNGVGFDMTYVDKIFGVFQRLHNQAEYEGTGVGLATVQRIIQRHSGRIWADAGIDAGAAFYFTLSESE